MPIPTTPSLRTRTALLAVVGLLLGSLPMSHAAGESGARDAFVIDDVRGNPTFPSVALDGGGDPHVLWQGSERARAAVLNRTTSHIEFNQSIDDLGGFATIPEPRLVSRGDALYAAWIDCCGPMGGAGVLAVSVSEDRGATFSRNLFAPAEDAGEDDIAVDGDGDLYLVWRDGVPWTSGAIAFSSLPPGGTIFTPRVLLATGNGTRPSVATEGGRVFVVWSDDDGSLRFRRSLDGGASFEPAVPIGFGGNTTASTPRIAAGPAGVYVVWQSEEPNGVHLRFAMSSDAGGTFDGFGALEGPAPRPELDPAISMGHDGNVYVAWVSFLDFVDSGLSVRVMRAFPDGSGWTEIALSAPKPPRGDQLSPSVGADSTGHVFLAYEAVDREGFFPEYTLWLVSDFPFPEIPPPPLNLLLVMGIAVVSAGGFLVAVANIYFRGRKREEGDRPDRLPRDPPL